MPFFSRIAQKICLPFIRHVSAAVSRDIHPLRRQLDDLMILEGRALASSNAVRAPLPNIHDAEFKVFSQFGEDGILQYLIGETGITREEAAFVEFGVQDYMESNTRFLLMNNQWRGLIIDGSKEYMDAVRARDLYWRHNLTAVAAWIDGDNINQLIEEAGFSGDIGILSIDIDGNDYWIWEKIEVVRPVIVVIEWNSVFGPDYPISVPYDPDFRREKAHYSNLFWGASISAMTHLAEQKGYSLVGSNTAGNNLFFVRRERLNRLKALSPSEAYVESKFRDSRDKEGRLTFLGGGRRRLEILNMSVVNVVTGVRVTLRELDEQAEV